MARILLIIFSLSAFLFANVPQYTVRLGIYHNHESLIQMVDQFSPALKKTVYFYKKGKETIATTLPTENKKILQKLLPAYKKVFSDAYILPVKKKIIPKTF